MDDPTHLISHDWSLTRPLLRLLCYFYIGVNTADVGGKQGEVITLQHISFTEALQTA